MQNRMMLMSIPQNDSTTNNSVNNSKKRNFKSSNQNVTPPNKYWVHFFNFFLFLAGPEGLSRKNFKIETR